MVVDIQVVEMTGDCRVRVRWNDPHVYVQHNLFNFSKEPKKGNFFSLLFSSFCDCQIMAFLPLPWLLNVKKRERNRWTISFVVVALVLSFWASVLSLTHTHHTHASLLWTTEELLSCHDVPFYWFFAPTTIVLSFLTSFTFSLLFNGLCAICYCLLPLLLLSRWNWSHISVSFKKFVIL